MALLNKKQLRHFWTRNNYGTSEAKKQEKNTKFWTTTTMIYIFLVINVREKRQISGETKSTWDGVYFGWVRQVLFFFINTRSVHGLLFWEDLVALKKARVVLWYLFHNSSCPGESIIVYPLLLGHVSEGQWLHQPGYQRKGIISDNEVGERSATRKNWFFKR